MIDIVTIGNEESCPWQQRNFKSKLRHWRSVAPYSTDNRSISKAHDHISIYVILPLLQSLISSSMSLVISFGSTVGVYRRYGCPSWSRRNFSKFHVMSSFFTGDQMIFSTSSITLSGTWHLSCKTRIQKLIRRTKLHLFLCEGIHQCSHNKLDCPVILDPNNNKNNPLSKQDDFVKAKGSACRAVYLVTSPRSPWYKVLTFINLLLLI